MPAVLSLPAAYGYVCLDVAAAWVMNTYMAISVSMARKKYDVPYPHAYAPANAKDPKAANNFNCTQRAHQNTLEGMPLFLATLLLGGLQHPEPAAAAGLLWVVGRFFYFNQYSTGDPAKRQAPGGGLGCADGFPGAADRPAHMPPPPAAGSSIAFLAQIALVGCTVSTGLHLAGIL